MLWEADPPTDIRERSPLALAFVGDGVLEALVRTRLVERTRLAPGRLHAAAVHFVCARSQCAALEAVTPLLTVEEAEIVHRGRNASKATVAKHATPREYRASTALEALFGWLYLQNRHERLVTLFDAVWNALLPIPDPASDAAPLKGQ